MFKFGQVLLHSYFILRIGRLKKDEAGQTGSNMAGLLGHRPQNHVNALVGISVEPLNVIGELRFEDAVKLYNGPLLSNRPSP